MIIVECINDDWDFLEPAKIAISKGAKYPKIGEKFTVSGTVSKISGYEGYRLEEINWSEFGIDVSFNINKFKIVEESFVVNHYDTKYKIGLCEVSNMTFEIEYKIKNSEENIDQTWVFGNDEE